MTIEAGTIVDVTDGPTEQSGLVIRVDGLIVPGLINLHDHISWNCHERFRESVLSGAHHRFANRYEWQRVPKYRAFSDEHRKMFQPPEARHVFDAFGEMRSLVGGTTCVGDKVEAPNAWTDALIRNATGAGLHQEIQKSIAYEVFFPNRAEIVESGKLVRDELVVESIRRSNVTILHLCEGVRGEPTTRAEFRLFLDWATANRDEARKVILVHANGLEEDDFRQLADLGVNRLIWSPYSNTLLYGQTLDLRSALKAGFLVALGTDWYPTGTDSMFDELRVASRAAATVPSVSDQDLVNMLLWNAAEMLGSPDKLGSIKPRAVADLVAIPKTGDSLMEWLLNADVDNVGLVVSRGRPLYGRSDWMRQIVEPVHRGSVPDRDWSFGFDWKPIYDYVQANLKPALPAPGKLVLEPVGDPGW